MTNNELITTPHTKGTSAAGAALRRETYTLPEAAAILGISRSSAYEAARTGQLPHIKIGRRLLVPVAQLTALLGTHDRCD